jgi:hypothetical protein
MYCKIIKNQIVQCSIHPEPDFEWVEGGACGMELSENGTYQSPIPTRDEILIRLRYERNQLLAQSDWMAVSDRTMTQAQIDYRQALRDLPETADPQLDEQGNLTNVTWPSYE